MRLLADESVDFPIIARLRRDGHEVASIADESPGIRDELVLARAWADGVILLTGDKDIRGTSLSTTTSARGGATI